MRIRFFAAAVLILSLFLLSCSPESPFLPVAGIGDSVTLEVSIPPGKILNPEIDGTIDIEFSYDELNVLPDSLEVAILDAAGSMVGEPEIITGSELNGKLPSIDTTSLQEGQYSLRLRVFDKDGQLLKETLTPFFTSALSIQIRGVDVYPPEFLPGSSGFLFPTIDAPGSVWLRWSLGDTVLSSGTLETYRQGLIWKAPEAEGVYTIKLEVFPVAPDTTYDFPSPRYTNIQVFVTSKINADKMDLGSGPNAEAVLNLDGTLKDEGIHEYSPYFTGSPVPGLYGGGFGYKLSREDGIAIDADILPYAEGILAPFSAVFGIVPNEPSSEMRVFTVKDGSGELFDVAIDSGGFYSASLRQGAGSIVSQAGIRFSDAREIVVNVIPEEKEVTFVWYADGKLSDSMTFTYEPVRESGSGVSSLGGFTGFADYFGIYSNLDDTVFNRMIKRSPPDGSIVFAEGFDGLELPSAIAGLNGGLENVYLKEGSLVLLPEGELNLFETGIDFTGMIVETELQNQEQGGFFVLTVSGAEGTASRQILYPLDGTALKITADPETGNLNVSSEDGPVKTVAFNGPDTLRAGIRNSGQEVALSIASVLAYTKEKKVVAEKSEQANSNL